MTHTNNGREFWLQVVPEDASTEFMYMKEGNIFIAETCTLVWCGNPPEPSHEKWDTVCEAILPLGSWVLHSDSRYLTEEEAAELVGVVYRSDLDPQETDLMNGDWVNGYRNYCNEDYTNHYLLAVQSFESLLCTLKINQRVIILERL
jgi:hypothetical protein